MKRIKNIILFLFCLQTFESNAQTISGIVNSYFKATYYASQYNGLKVPGVTGLVKGDRVLIIQMKGALIDETNTATFGNISSVNGAGQYEFATICGFVNDTVGFEKELSNTYDFTKAVQVIYVPVYTDVTVNGTLLPQEWNPITETGGVIAIEATGTVTLNVGINANGVGYRGGALLSFSTCNFFTNPNSYYYSPATVIGNNNNGTYNNGEKIIPDVKVLLQNSSLHSCGLRKHLPEATMIRKVFQKFLPKKTKARINFSHTFDWKIIFRQRLIIKP